MAALTTAAIAAGVAGWGFGATTATVLGAATVGAIAGQGFNTYQAGRKQASREKRAIAKEEEIATEKRTSLIRQQRAQLGSGRSGTLVTSPTGYTSQQNKDEETLG